MLSLFSWWLFGKSLLEFFISPTYTTAGFTLYTNIWFLHVLLPSHQRGMMEQHCRSAATKASGGEPTWFQRKIKRGSVIKGPSQRTRHCRHQAGPDRSPYARTLALHMAHIQLDDDRRSRGAKGKFQVCSAREIQATRLTSALQGNVNWWVLVLSASDKLIRNQVANQQDDWSSSGSCCRHASNKELYVPNNTNDLSIRWQLNYCMHA